MRDHSQQLNLASKPLVYSLQAAQTLPSFPLRATFCAQHTRGRMDTWTLTLNHWENIDG